ncbi:MAG: M56 family metallopeptidase [Phycisphaerales bacterium]
MDLSRLVQLVWIGGLAATPIVIGVSLLCRSHKLRPATKHALWAAALASFLTPLAVAAVWRNTWFASERVLSLADRVLPEGTHEAKDTVRIEPGVAAGGSVNAGVEAMEAPAKASDVNETPRGMEVPAKLMATSEPRVPIAIPMVETTASLRSAPVQLMDDRGIESKPVARPASQHGVEQGALAGPARPHGSEETPATTKAQTIGLHDQSAARAGDAGVKASIAGSMSRSTRVVLEKLVAVRDAIAGLPPVPIYVWIGIAAVLVLLRTFRSVTLRRIVNRARPAPRRMRELVSDMAGVMGLASPPETLTTESRISPMVWCGVRPKLVIPEDLWASLDDDSRRAVIAHELAHLKRRDHLLHWVAALVGAAYWWHPAAWWARRKMNEEAEASCDAWVTSLFPRRRRAYAEALLVTSSFLGSPAYHAGPALGVVDGRTKLARRITMVMTQRTAPNASKIGVIVASLVLATGALVTPGLACPPEKEKAAGGAASSAGGGSAGGAFLGEAPAIDAMIKAEKAQAEKAAKSKNKTKRKVSGQTTTVAPDALATPSDTVTIYRGQAVSPDAMARAYVVDRAQLERAQELAQVYADTATQNQARAAQNQAQAAANQARAAERAAKAYSDAVRRANRSRTVAGLTTPAAPIAPVAPLAPMTPMPAMPAMPPSPPAAMSPFAAQAPMATQPSLDAFGGAATISGPAEGTEPREYRLPGGKLQALSELMARQDVPIWIERGAGKIVVYATPEQHEVFAAFVKLINPDGSSGGGHSSGAFGTTAPHASAQALDALRAKLDALNAQRDTHEARVDQLRERADEMREKADRLREMAEELREKANEAANDAARNALHQAEQTLSEQSNGLETQVADIEAQAEAFEGQMSQIEETIASLEANIEQMDAAEEQASAEDMADAVEVEGVMAADTVEVTVPEVNIEEGDLDLQIPADLLEAPEAPATTTPAPAPAQPTL